MKRGNWVYTDGFSPINLDKIMVIRIYTKNVDYFIIEFFNQDETKIGSWGFSNYERFKSVVKKLKRKMRRLG